MAVANRLVRFLGDAHSTLDLAVYDFRLEAEPAELVLEALGARAKAGVTIRIAFDPTSANATDGDTPDPTTLGASRKPPVAPLFSPASAKSQA
jgi:hypothetical protein